MFVPRLIALLLLRVLFIAAVCGVLALSCVIDLWNQGGPSRDVL
jgi:hypothetical protein